jgi:hypothetical protein
VDIEKLTYREIDIELQKALASINWRDPQERSAFAETIVEVVKYDVERDNLIDLFAEQEVIPVGASKEWVVRKGIKAYIHEPGSYAPRSTITNITNTIQSEMASVHPQMELGQLESGRYGTVADIRKMCKDELLGMKYGTIWNVMIASIASSDSNYQTYSATNDNLVTKKNVLVSGLKWVNDIGQGAKAIVGRYSLVSDITEFDGYSETWKEQVDREGFLGAFRGVPILSLKQYTNGDGIRMINADNVFISSNGTAKIAVTQELRVEEDKDIDTLFWHMHMYEKYGCAVFFPERNYRIAVTSSPWG